MSNLYGRPTVGAPPHNAKAPCNEAGVPMEGHPYKLRRLFREVASHTSLEDNPTASAAP